MANLNKILKLGFICAAAIFLFIWLTVPKTHCQACKFQFGEEVFDGYNAYELFEQACISYPRPTSNEPIYLDIDDIEVSYTEEGVQKITFDS